MLARPRPYVDDIVGHSDRLFVVLDDKDGVADVAQAQQRLHELAVVALVQADRRLIKHVEDPNEPTANLGGKADPLRLASGEGGGRAVEAQVVEPDVDEELEAGTDLFHDPGGDHLLARGQLEPVEQVVSRPDRQTGELGDAAPADLDRERLGAKPRPPHSGQGTSRM